MQRRERVCAYVCVNIPVSMFKLQVFSNAFNHCSIYQNCSTDYFAQLNVA